MSVPLRYLLDAAHQPISLHVLEELQAHQGVLQQLRAA